MENYEVGWLPYFLVVGHPHSERLQRSRLRLELGGSALTETAKKLPRKWLAVGEDSRRGCQSCNGLKAHRGAGQHHNPLQHLELLHLGAHAGHEGGWAKKHTFFEPLCPATMGAHCIFLPSWHRQYAFGGCCFWDHSLQGGAGRVGSNVSIAETGLGKRWTRDIPCWIWETTESTVGGG